MTLERVHRSVRKDEAAGRKSPRKSPLFIFGFPRSGTTLIRSVLNSHSEISLLNEPEIISSLRRSGFSTRDQLNNLDRTRFLADYGSTCFGKNHLLTLPAERIDAFLQHPGQLSFAECFERLLPRPANPVVWGDKSLALGFYLKDVQELYPNFLAVSMIRDPRASILSLYRKRKLKSPSGQPRFSLKTFSFFVYQSMLWCEWMNEADRAKDHFAKHICELRFEDFLFQPGPMAQQLCERIGIQFEDAMLDKAKRKTDSVLKTDHARAHHLLDQDLIVSRAAAARELCPWATLVIQSVCATHMEGHGYTPSRIQMRHGTKWILNRLLALLSPGIRRKVLRDVARHRETPNGLSSAQPSLQNKLFAAGSQIVKRRLATSGRHLT